MASELKAMPWSEQEEEEKRVVLSLVPLQEDESDDQELRLAARFSLFPAAAVTASSSSSSSSVEEMLLELIHDQYPNLASSEAFRDSVRRALNQSFEVRMKLVKDWLPVLIVGKEKVLPIFTRDESAYRDLEKAFLRIISTLPMTDSQELLKQCINLEESPELLSVFITWFRRAAQPSA